MQINTNGPFLAEAKIPKDSDSFIPMKIYIFCLELNKQDQRSLS